MTGHPVTKGRVVSNYTILGLPVANETHHMAGESNNTNTT